MRFEQSCISCTIELMNRQKTHFIEIEFNIFSDDQTRDTSVTSQSGYTQTENIDLQFSAVDGVKNNQTEQPAHLGNF